MGIPAEAFLKVFRSDIERRYDVKDQVSNIGMENVNTSDPTNS